MKLYEIEKKMETLAPLQTAEEWDNVGILIGTGRETIKKALITLDITSDVVEEAVLEGADLIISHHPLFLEPIKKINDNKILKLMHNHICVYCAHTNLDVCVGGVSYALCEKLGISVVDQENEICVGKIKPVKISQFIEFAKQSLGVSAARAAFKRDILIDTVAVCGGSGGDFLQKAAQAGAQILVTGEAKYHTAQVAAESDIALLALGHYETEIYVIEKLFQYLKVNVTDVTLIQSKKGKNFYNIF